MLKYYLRLILLVGGVVAVFLLLEQLAPRGYDFQESVTINAPADKVFPEIDFLKNWPRWSKQFNVDVIEGLQIHYNATAAGEGAAQTWTERRGAGKLWITESVTNQRVVYVSEFADFPTMKSTFELTSIDDQNPGQTRVTWRSQGTLPRRPLFGLLRSICVTHLGYEYERSLESLKQLLEPKQQEAPGAAVK